MSLQCDKYLYSSKQIALEAVTGIKKAKARRGLKKPPVSVYFCTSCNGWHMTSKKKKKVIANYSFTKSFDSIRKKEKNETLRIKILTSN